MKNRRYPIKQRATYQRTMDFSTDSGKNAKLCCVVFYLRLSRKIISQMTLILFRLLQGKGWSHDYGNTNTGNFNGRGNAHNRSATHSWGVLETIKFFSVRTETQSVSVFFRFVSRNQKTFFSVVSVCFGVSDQYRNNRNKQNFLETNRKKLEETFSIPLIFFLKPK